MRSVRAAGESWIGMETSPNEREPFQVAGMSSPCVQLALAPISRSPQGEEWNGTGFACHSAREIKPEWLNSVGEYKAKSEWREWPIRVILNFVVVHLGRRLQTDPLLDSRKAFSPLLRRAARGRPKN